MTIPPVGGPWYASQDRSHGDWASNAAMQLAKKAGISRVIWRNCLPHACNPPTGRRRRVPAAHNINDSVSAAAVVDAVLEQGAQFGRNATCPTDQPRIVSANPTGPIHIGGTRWGGRRLYGRVLKPTVPKSCAILFQ